MILIPFRGLRLRLLLGGVCRAPERARVDAIGIDFQHCVVELARSRCCRIQAVEIAKVLPRLGNDAGIIVVFWHLVPGDYSLRLQGLILSIVEIPSTRLPVSGSPN